MNNQTFSIGELADAAGVTRRSVHFYSQRGLLPRPDAKGRGAKYSEEHLERLRQILRLQQAGHSLAAIARLVGIQEDNSGGLELHDEEAQPYGSESTSSTAPPAKTLDEPMGRIQSQLLIRLRLAEGIELVLDTQKYNPTAEAIIALRSFILPQLKKGEPS